MIRRSAGLCCLVTAAFATFSPSAHAAARPDHVAIVTIPGFDWDVLARAHHPQLQRLVDTGAVAALSTRSVTKGSTPIRGYLTLGAGSRAFAMTESKPRRDEPVGQVALAAGDRYENGTAAAAMARRVVRPRTGGVVVPDAPALDAAQDGLHYGTRVGDLGEALARAGVRRALVDAGDLAVSPGLTDMRRSAALALVDYSGTIDTGTVDGLLRPSVDGAYGVETDPVSFGRAVRRALASASVVLADPGETLRADEFALQGTPREADAQRVAAMQRTDTLLGEVAAALGPRDVLYVVGVSTSLADARDHLTLIVAHGYGVRRGWLTSATTHRRGIVTLTDVAPTILADAGVRVPDEMSGTPMRAVAAKAAHRVEPLASLDAQTGFGDRFQGVAAKLVVGLLGAVAAALAALAYGARMPRRVVAGLCLATLAVPPAAYVLRVLPVYRAGIVGASVVMCALVAAAAAAVLPLHEVNGALVLAGLSFAVTTGDLLAGAPLQTNNVFGYSPISAGRFYGDSNIEFAVLISTALVVVFGLLELTRVRAWAAGVLVAVVVIQGLPQFGADFGGVVASVPAILVAYAVARGRRMRLARVAAWAGAGVAAAAGVTLLDLLRPPAARTHLGRFAADLASGRTGGAVDLVTRKVQSNIGLLGSAWSWTIAVAVAVALLLWKLGAFAEMRRVHPMLAAAVAGTLAAGVVGFAVNDTGIWVFGMAAAYAAPVAVLLGIVSTGGRACVQGPAQEAGRLVPRRP